jgi:hypothetical protein
MITRIAASIAMLIALTFWAWLAYTIASIPLTIVFVVGAVLMIADFYGALRRPEAES